VLLISAAEDKRLLILLLQGVETEENNFNQNNCFLTFAGSKTRNWPVKILVLGVGVGNACRFIFIFFI
jgi:hypothetical protein